MAQKHRHTFTLENLEKLRDPTIALIWRSKDVLPLRKRIYYGKVLRKISNQVEIRGSAGNSIKGNWYIHTNFL